MRKFLLKLLIRWYVKQNRDISKLSIEKEYEKMLFKNQQSIYDILRARLSKKTLDHFAANTDFERAIIKGGALELKILLDLHRTALEIDEKKDVSRETRIRLYKKLSDGIGTIQK